MQMPGSGTACSGGFGECGIIGAVFVGVSAGLVARTGGDSTFKQVHIDCTVPSVNDKVAPVAQHESYVLQQASQAGYASLASLSVGGCFSGKDPEARHPTLRQPGRHPELLGLAWSVRHR